MREPPDSWGRNRAKRGQEQGTGVVDEGRHRRDGEPDVPWYESRRRVRRFPAWLGPGIAVGGVGLLVAGIVLFGSSAVPEKISGSGSSGCEGLSESANIAASPGLVPALQRAAADWSLQQPKIGGACAQVSIAPADSSAMAAVLGDEDAKNAPSRPDVWVPDSTAWPALAVQRPEAAAALPKDPPVSLATSPIVLAMPRDRATALGWPKKPVSLTRLLAGLRKDPTWKQYGHPRWGPVVIGMSDVTRSTADLHALLAVTDSNRNGKVDAPEIQNELLLERSVGKHVTWTSELFKLAASGAPISAFPATEQQVLAYNATAESRRLVPVHPAEGVAGANYPYLVLDGDWVTPQAQEIAKTFLTYLQSPGGRSAFAREGFRDPNRQPTGIAAASDPSLIPPNYPTRTLLAPTQAAGALVRWRALRRPANVLAAIDTSGSMADPAPGTPTTKLRVFQQAAVQAVSLFNARSRLGVWEFSARLTPTTDYRSVVPQLPLGQKVAPNVTARQAVFAAVNRMRPVGGTGLYDTIDAGYRQSVKVWRKDQQNILVVMTDGKNEDRAGLSLPQLVQRLKSTRNAKKPVTVILFAYGADADVPALNQAAKATGGRLYVVRQPADIGKAFLAAMVNR
jgi:Ca-activated chloride channel homolog